ncbi:MAG: DEAD/DEAH box helicase [Campylobacterota bacterium]|nr:DEAD/DEAH box helicase [Campylobacterota bacterium]
MLFHTLGLNQEVLKAVQKSGYKEPTPVQKEVIPALLRGRDIFATAQTGSGKTASYLLPLLQLLTKQPAQEGFRHPRILIITPTRELIIQVGRSLDEFASNLHVNHNLIYGGAKIEPQINRLNEGTDIVVATPGRLLDIIKLKQINLSQIEHFVIDEADSMFDTGFHNDVYKIVDLLPATRQTLLFSATLMGKVKMLSEKVLRKPLTFEVNRAGEIPKTVKHSVCLVDDERKSELLSFLIGAKNWHKVLVFAKTKKSADDVAAYLNETGLSSLAIHGEHKAGARKRTLDAFREGKIRVLVGTDIAARGLDIDELDYVINYEMPSVNEDYVHRVGRTGRAGREGEAISLVSSREDYYLKAVERLIKFRIPQLHVKGYERMVHEKSVGSSEVKQIPKEKSTKGAFGRRQRKGPATKKKRTKRDGPAASRFDDKKKSGK